MSVSSLVFRVLLASSLIVPFVTTAAAQTQPPDANPVPQESTTSPVPIISSQPQTESPITAITTTQPQPSSPIATAQPQPDPATAAPAPNPLPARINPPPAKPVPQPEPKKNDRIFGVIPNYRTVEDQESEPKRIGAGEKFKLGLEDSFDYYAYPAAGLFAGINQLQKQTPSFGQGAAGFSRYLGTSFADQTIGNIMSESVFPTLFRQDPRYFPLAKGGIWKRTVYAISREVITRNDSGKNGVNISELGGNAAAVAISNLYYPNENRNVSDNANKFAQQIELDAFFNVLKEFYPDIRRKWFGK
jgi:hypothetical protein